MFMLICVQENKFTVARALISRYCSRLLRGGSSAVGAGSFACTPTSDTVCIWRSSRGVETDGMRTTAVCSTVNCESAHANREYIYVSHTTKSTRHCTSIQDCTFFGEAVCSASSMGRTVSCRGCPMGTAHSAFGASSSGLRGDRVGFCVGVCVVVERTSIAGINGQHSNRSLALGAILSTTATASTYNSYSYSYRNRDARREGRRAS